MVILTDLSEVLIQGITGLEQLVAARYGKTPAERVELMGRFATRRLWIKDDFLNLMRGRITEDAYWHKFFAYNKWPFSIDEIEALFSENLKITIPGTLDLYRRIVRHPRSVNSGRGEDDYVEGAPQFILVSDHIAERLNELKLYHPDVFKLMSDEYWSCDMGCVKNDEDFFPNVLHDIDISSSNVLVIDDNRDNLQSAARIDIHGILFHNATQLETVLREAYGFEFAPTLSSSPTSPSSPTPPSSPTGPATITEFGPALTQ
ncbi:hypothetical protein IJ118_02925 [Candidatus Saccharibacteria bacterium]|nr:hypothetical protein [Candidatus Saccharibacteria bacterium]